MTISVKKLGEPCANTKHHKNEGSFSATAIQRHFFKGVNLDQLLVKYVLEKPQGHGKGATLFTNIKTTKY